MILKFTSCCFTRFIADVAEFSVIGIADLDENKIKYFGSGEVDTVENFDTIDLALPRHKTAGILGWVRFGSRETSRYVLFETVYLMNDQGKTIDTVTIWESCKQNAYKDLTGKDYK